MALDDPSRDVSHIPEEVKAIGDLNRLWCTALRSVGISCPQGTRAQIPTHDLGSWMLSQPRGHGVRGAIGQEIDHAVPLEVHDDGSIGPTFAEGDVVDGEDTGRGSTFD